ncbi:MAG: MGMT family protein [Clostridia bacterium]|nr:MGMT family protein [Clostridia bacterium]
MKNFFERVYDAVKQIPKGKVATYGQIALAAGSPRAARQVGYALHVNPQPGIIPCHRVVNRFGGLAPAFAFGGQEVQASLLKKEGVAVCEDFTVDLEKYLYRGEFINVEDYVE